MSIATEITRLKEAKASLKTSIENKGVTVGETTKLNEYSSLVDSIQAGEDINEYILNNGGNYVQTLFKKIPPINWNNIMSVNGYFRECSNLLEIPQIINPRTTYTNYGNLFQMCGKIKSIPQLPSNNVTIFSYMCQSCFELENVPEIDASSAIDITNIFAYCRALVNFGGLKNLGKSYSTSSSANNSSYKLNLSASTLLTHESLMNVINGLYDIASLGCNTQNLNLGTTNLAKLTEDEIAIATNKGWNVT